MVQRPRMEQSGYRLPRHTEALHDVCRYAFPRGCCPANGECIGHFVKDLEAQVKHALTRIFKLALGRPIPSIGRVALPSLPVAQEEGCAHGHS